MAGGVPVDLGEFSEKRPGGRDPIPIPGEVTNGGGEAGDEGPPLEVLGGLMRFSFWRLERDQA